VNQRFASTCRCSDGRSKALVTFCTLGIGRSKVTSAIRDLITELNPRTIFLVGFCAGLKHIEQQRGDVVISDLIVEQAIQKLSEMAEPDLRLDFYPPPANILENCQVAPRHHPFPLRSNEWNSHFKKSLMSNTP